MTQLTNLSPAASYGDILTTTNGGQGLTNALMNVQDGLGNDSPIQIAKNKVNFNRTGGRQFQLDGIPLTVSATNLNAIGGGISLFGSGVLLPEEITSMHGASVSLIDAMGPDTIILVNKFLLLFEFESIQYDGGLNERDVYLQYSANGAIAGNNFASNKIKKDIIIGLNNSVASANGIAQSENGDPIALGSIMNVPVCITNMNNNFTNGDSEVKYYIYYTILTV